MTKANGNGHHYDEAVVNALTSEANFILAGIKDDAEVRLLKFSNGEFKVGSENVALGTKFFADVPKWTKAWIKFEDKKVVDRKLYRVARGEVPPDRLELDDLHLANHKREDGMSDDPWSYQYQLPLEDVTTGAILIFTTQSLGGQRAVRELGDEYAKRAKTGLFGGPIVQLATQDMTTQHGTVSRPLFKIVGWEDDAERATPENSLTKVLPVQRADKADDMDDEIPF
jgi:hypothetical protein